MPSVLARLSGAARGKSRSVLMTGISHAILKRDVGKLVRISHPETASLVGAAKAVEVSVCYILGNDRTIFLAIVEHKCKEHTGYSLL